MLVAFSGLSFAVHGLPGVPRRVQSPNTWNVKDSWTVARVSPGAGCAHRTLLSRQSAAAASPGCAAECWRKKGPSHAACMPFADAVVTGQQAAAAALHKEAAVKRHSCIACTGCMHGRACPTRLVPPGAPVPRRTWAAWAGAGSRPPWCRPCSSPSSSSSTTTCQPSWRSRQAPASLVTASAGRLAGAGFGSCDPQEAAQGPHAWTSLQCCPHRGPGGPLWAASKPGAGVCCNMGPASGLPAARPALPASLPAG